MCLANEIGEGRLSIKPILDNINESVSSICCYTLENKQLHYAAVKYKYST